MKIKNLWFYALAGLSLLPIIAHARGQNQSPTWQQYRAEGDTTVLFNIGCTSYTWTVVLSSEPTSRSALYQALNDNTVGVCLSSTTTSAAQACNSSTPGILLTPNSNFTDYSTQGWACECRTGAACNVDGYRSLDSGDKGGIR
jgi:hypothetical protein